jgi:hypothetical protein
VSRVGIIVEGGLLAAELVERIALGDEAVKGQQAKDFDIEVGRLSAEIQAAFSDIRVFWDAFKRRREHAQTSAVTLTREGWVIPFLERLGYALRFQRAGILISGQNYLLSHRVGDGETAMPVHIVAWNQPLGQRGDDKRSPHALLQEYLNRSDALWGIVTNGRELRLLRNSARSSRPSYVASISKPSSTAISTTSSPSFIACCTGRGCRPTVATRTIACSKPGMNRGSKKAVGSAKACESVSRRRWKLWVRPFCATKTTMLFGARSPITVLSKRNSIASC